MTEYLIFFSANLAFIITHLYGWLLKWFFCPNAYREHFHELFPAQRAVGIIYLMQVFELPYLFQIGSRDALLYVNAFSLLFFSIQMLFMCEGYFFPKKKHHWREHLIFLPAVFTIIPLFLQAVGLIQMPDGWRNWLVGAVSLCFLLYFCLNVLMALKIKRAVQRANEECYADSDDFPVRFANLIRWVPTCILLLLAVNFYADNPWVKFTRDMLFIVASIWFCIITLNPWRKIMNSSESKEQGSKLMDEDDTSDMSHFLNDARYDELASKLDLLLSKEHIFTEPHITVDTLIVRLGTNSKYLAEVIHRSGYQSFYDMICQHRVRHAIGIIHQHPDELLQNVATACGFTSQASMAKAFKSQGKHPPSSYRE